MVLSWLKAPILAILKILEILLLTKFSRNECVPKFLHPKW